MCLSRKLQPLIVEIKPRSFLGSEDLDGDLVSTDRLSIRSPDIHMEIFYLAFRH